MSHHTTRHNGTFKNEIGNRYGRLLVIEEAPPPEHYKEKRQGFWLCRCDCGNTVVASGALLRRGMTMSCGCSLTDYHARRQANAIRHLPEYGVWHHINRRCHDPRDDRYYMYGARGITVCERWRASFRAFLEDVGRRPSPQHTIDRIDVNGNYEPSNVRWATPKEQANNRRNTIRLTHQGKTLTLAEWADELGIPLSTICNRYYRQRRSVGEVLFVGNLKQRST